MSRISSHILDTSAGRPAVGVTVRLYRENIEIGRALTDADGRCVNLLDGGVSLTGGTYRLVFEVASYFPDGFYPEVSVLFKVSEGTDHYHVPLLLSAFGYTTYRGS